MRRGTIFIIIFVLIAAVVIGANQFFGAQPAVEITLAVDPLVQPWAQDAVNAYNATAPTFAGRRVQFRLILTEDLTVWKGQQNWKPENHPDGWIAASSLSVQYARDNGLPLATLADSLGRTPLVWGGYVDRVGVMTESNTAPFDWAAVEKAARAVRWSAINGQSDWGFVKLGFPQPESKIAGLAALFSAAASFSNSSALDQNALLAQPFRDWLLPVLEAKPSFFGRGDIGDQMNSGPSTIEIALLPEVSWLNKLPGLLTYDSRFRFSYPSYQFQLDFPLSAWQDAQTADYKRAAFDGLRSWLVAPAQQAKLPTYGLRPATGEPEPTASLFAAGQPYGILIEPDYGQAVQPPARTDVTGLLQYVASNQ